LSPQGVDPKVYEDWFTQQALFDSNTQMLEMLTAALPADATEASAAQELRQRHETLRMSLDSFQGRSSSELDLSRTVSKLQQNKIEALCIRLIEQHTQLKPLDLLSLGFVQQRFSQYRQSGQQRLEQALASDPQLAKLTPRLQASLQALRSNHQQIEHALECASSTALALLAQRDEQLQAIVEQIKEQGLTPEQHASLKQAIDSSFLKDYLDAVLIRQEDGNVESVIFDKFNEQLASLEHGAFEAQVDAWLATAPPGRLQRAVSAARAGFVASPHADTGSRLATQIGQAMAQLAQHQAFFPVVNLKWAMIRDEIVLELAGEKQKQEEQLLQSGKVRQRSALLKEGIASLKEIKLETLEFGQQLDQVNNRIMTAARNGVALNDYEHYSQFATRIADMICQRVLSPPLESPPPGPESISDPGAAAGPAYARAMTRQR
jgi:hypothetical protein